MNDQSIEKEIQEKGLTAPRITPDLIQDNIKSVFYFTALQGSRMAVLDESVDTLNPSLVSTTALDPTLGLLTICVIVLRNGFTVTGESACASPENFDAEIGRKIARQNAIEKVWPLMGYELRSKIAGAK